MTIYMLPNFLYALSIPGQNRLSVLDYFRVHGNLFLYPTTVKGLFRQKFRILRQSTWNSSKVGMGT